MPPKRSQKSAKLKKEDAERQKKLLSAKEKVLATKRMLLAIIEAMIENNISEEWFLSNCSKLCQSDYNDVVQERSIENLCGYPLCSNLIKETMKQKYHISQVSNKVYDLTERKCFCSNQCYKASNYLRAQLSPIPLYMRKEEKITVHILSGDNRGSAGEEVVFHHIIPREEINKVYTEVNSTNLQNLLNEEVKKCADSLSELQIKEHVFEKQYIFGDETPKKSDDSIGKDQDRCDSDIDSDDSEDENLFPRYDNVSELSNRHMPIPIKIKKSVLIPPINPEIKTNIPVQKLSLDFVHNAFKDWMTEDTFKYLLGEKYIYGLKADHLFKAMTESDPSNSEKLSYIKNEYIKLCLKIDSLPDGDDDLSDSADLDIVCLSTTVSESKVNQKQKTETENSSVKRIFKRRPRKSKENNKRVTFAPEVEKAESSVELKSESMNKTENRKMDEKVAETLPEIVKSSVQEQNKTHIDEKNVPLDNEKKTPRPQDPLPEPIFPLVDSVSQNILRKQVLMDKLKSVYAEILPVVGLHYTDIRGAVRKFVDSISLTPTNIIFKPKEWKLISLVLFRVLTKTTLKEIYDELQFAKLCEDPLIPIAIDLREIENLVGNILSTENIINLPGQ